MGMGYSPCSAYTIKQEVLEGIVPQEWKAFTDKIAEYGTSLEEHLRTLDESNMIEGLGEEKVDELDQLWKEVQKSFKNKTGLDIFPGYHDSSEEGDRYDGVDGLYFSFKFDQLFRPTPELQALIDKDIEVGFTQWVIYG